MDQEQDIKLLFEQASFFIETNDNINLNNQLIQIAEILEPNLNQKQSIELQEHFNKIKRLHHNIKLEKENIQLLATAPVAQKYFRKGLIKLYEFLEKIK